MTYDQTMHFLTNLTALAAAILSVITLWGLRSFIKLRPTTSGQHMITGFALADAVAIGRTLTWDVIPYLSGVKWSARGISPHEVNWAFNLATLIACWLILHGIWLRIPEAERRHWSTLTAAFYPRRLLSRLKWRDEE